MPAPGADTLRVSPTATCCSTAAVARAEVLLSQAGAEVLLSQAGAVVSLVLLLLLTLTLAMCSEHSRGLSCTARPCSSWRRSSLLLPSLPEALTVHDMISWIPAQCDRRGHRLRRSPLSSAIEVASNARRWSCKVSLGDSLAAWTQTVYPPFPQLPSPCRHQQKATV